jgi:hypothetical protein
MKEEEDKSTAKAEKDGGTGRGALENIHQEKKHRVDKLRVLNKVHI